MRYVSMKNTKIAVKVKGHRSNVTNFQALLAFTMGHIPTMLHQFLISSFRDFVRTDAQTHRRRQKLYLFEGKLDTDV